MGTMIQYLIQYFVALVLLVTAIGKLLDIQGFAKVIETYKVFTGWITAPLGLIMSLTELGISIWLFSGIKLHSAALSSFLLHTIFIIWLLIAIVRKLKIPNCGCFGVFWPRPLNWITLIEDLFMLGLSAILYLL